MFAFQAPKLLKLFSRNLFDCDPKFWTKKICFWTKQVTQGPVRLTERNEPSVGFLNDCQNLDSYGVRQCHTI